MRMRDHRPLLLFLLLAFAIMIAVCAGHAEEASPYRIVITTPGRWNNNNAAVVRVSLTDLNSQGWQRIEYRMNSGNWLDCENLFSQNKAEITVRENGTFALRITDPNGWTFEETAKINTVDLAAPVVSAVIRDKSLHIEITDDLSGIAGVQVNSMLFTTVTDSVLDIELDQNINKFEKLAVRAFDYAGNFSEPIALDNPCYEKPADPTPLPTAKATAKPTKKPSGSQQSEEDQPTDAPTASPSPTVKPASTDNSHHGLGSSLIYVSDNEIPVVTTAPTPVPTTAPTPEPIIQTEYITIGPGMPYQADGNSHTLDVLYSAATNKQFITLQSKSGNTFYLVIDYDKPIDEEAELYETYFLNLVDERDLLALLSDEEKEEVPTPTPQVIYVTPVPTNVPVVTAPPADTDDKKPDQMTAIAALIGIILLAGIGVFVLLRGKNKTTGAPLDNDFEMENEDDEDETDEKDQQQE